MRIFIKTKNVIKNCSNINTETMKHKDIKNWNILNNDENFASPSDRTDANMRQNINSDKSFDLINKIDWKNESNYHNSYRINGKENKGRTLKLKK